MPRPAMRLRHVFLFAAIAVAGCVRSGGDPNDGPAADVRHAPPPSGPGPDTAPAPHSPTSPAPAFPGAQPLAGDVPYRGKSLAEWVAALGGKETAVRVEAVEAVTRYASNAKDAVPALVKILNDPRDEAFVGAFGAVRAIGPGADAAVPRLIELLRHNQSETRGLAAGTLAALGPPAGKAVPVLIDRLGDDGGCSGTTVREIATRTLEAVGKYDVRTAFDAARSGKLSAAALGRIIGSLGADDGQAVEGLAQQLKREDKLFVSHAIQGLQRIGPVAAPALPALRAHLDGADAENRVLAAKAVEAIGSGPPPKPEPERPALAEAPAKPDPKPGPRAGDAPLELNTVLAKAGFEAKRDWGRHLPSYVRFGTKAAADKYFDGDRFDKIEIEKQTKDHRAAVAKLSFRMSALAYRPIVREDIETEGLLAEVTLPFRARGSKPFYDDDLAFRGALFGLKPSEVDTRRFWFLTKDGQLRACTPAEATVVKRNDGVLYHPEVANTTLVLVLKGELGALKDMARNAAEYAVEIDFTELRFDRPRAWGYFRKDALLEARGDCEQLWEDFLDDEDAPQPVYFATALVGEAKIPEIVQGKLKALRVVGKGGKVVGEYRPE